jgi:DNA-binding response OmpR family regulator
MSFRILTVDDDPATLLVVERALERAGFDVWTAPSGEAGMEILRRQGLPHLAVVDLLMPGMGGLDFCRQLKEWSDVPLVILTSVHTKETLIDAIERFAEDYIVKPFDPRELVARANRVLRRIGDFAYLLAPVTAVDGHLSIDFVHHRALVDGRDVELGAIESKLLYLLMKGAGRPQSNAHLLGRLWPNQEVFEDTLRVHVHRLRRKIEPQPAEPRYVVTERGIGYSFPLQGAGGERPAG